jgi:hypothetical protein
LGLAVARGTARASTGLATGLAALALRGTRCGGSGHVRRHGTITRRQVQPTKKRE